MKEYPVLRYRCYLPNSPSVIRSSLFKDIDALCLHLYHHDLRVRTMWWVGDRLFMTNVAGEFYKIPKDTALIEYWMDVRYD